MLIVMAGLPGSGKSTLARDLARALGCTHLSVDPIEAAMWRAGIARDQPTGLAAYVIAEDLAREQLRAGNDVIVDAVNDVQAARDQWRELAAQMTVPLTFIEVVCSDAEEHRRRLGARVRDLVGFPEPRWESVVARRRGFQSWADERLRVDSMHPRAESVTEILTHLQQTRHTKR